MTVPNSDGDEMPLGASTPNDSIGLTTYPPPKRGIVRRTLLAFRDGAITLYGIYLRKLLGMNIHPTCRFSLKANFDRTNPRGVHIGSGTYVAFGAVILTHDMSRLIHADTFVGSNCFIGANAIILPGIRIGDECIIGSGAVVTRDVPSNSVCVGNPARIVRSGIRTVEWGILAEIMAEKKRLAESA